MLSTSNFSEKSEQEDHSTEINQPFLLMTERNDVTLFPYFIDRPASNLTVFEARPCLFIRISQAYPKAVAYHTYSPETTEYTMKVLQHL